MVGAAFEVDGVGAALTFLVVRRERWRSSREAGGLGRRAGLGLLVEASRRSLGISPEEEFFVEFWRAISIWRISLARG